MMYRIRKCSDGFWYWQEKRAPGLAGGIWRRIGDGYGRREDAASIIPNV